MEKITGLNYNVIQTVDSLTDDHDLPFSRDEDEGELEISSEENDFLYHRVHDHPRTRGPNYEKWVNGSHN